MVNIYSLTRQELENELSLINEKPFRAVQIFEWIYKKGVDSFYEMTNIAKSSRENLDKHFTMNILETAALQESSDGTKKFLFTLADGNHIETVLMKQNYGNSVCVSTQVGCNMGCSFCASGLYKKKRNLEVYEMVEQVLIVKKLLQSQGEDLTHIVVMGIGEPFDNYDNLISFLQIVNDAKGMEIGARHITVSTCGIVPRIYDFANFPLQINLAISLHFPNDSLRSQYMKINKVYNLEALFKALEYYYEKTNRRLTFEYILLEGINDTKECALELVTLLKGINCYVNLIPMNASVLAFKRSSKKQMDQFYQILASHKLNVTLRREQGHDIDAACGQLRIKREGNL